MCIRHVARGGLDFWGKDEGNKERQPASKQEKLPTLKTITVYPTDWRQPVVGSQYSVVQTNQNWTEPIAPNEPNLSGSNIECKCFTEMEL